MAEKSKYGHFIVMMTRIVLHIWRTKNRLGIRSLLKLWVYQTQPESKTKAGSELTKAILSKRSVEPVWDKKKNLGFFRWC